MSTIHMQVESAQVAVKNIQADGARLLTSLDTIRQAVQSLSSAWEGGASEDYINQSGDTIRRLNQQAEDLILLLQCLEREVQEWQETDRRGASLFSDLSSNGIGQMLSFGSGSSLPLSAGGWSDGAGIFSFSLLPFSASVSAASLLQGMPDWLRKLLDRFFPQGDANSSLPSDVFPKRPAPQTPSVTFGDLLKKTGDQPSGSTVNTASASANAVQPSPNSTSGNYYNVPALSQGDLYGSAACSVTSTTMVMDYYHNQDSSHATITQETLLSSLDPGDKTSSKGINLDNMKDEIQVAGYNVPLSQGGADMDILKTQLIDGPVIVTTGVGIVGPGTVTSNVPRAITGPGNTIHAMVVKGISTDEKSIVINDPWTGQEQTYSMDTFKTMWQKGQNGIFVIRP